MKLVKKTDAYSIFQRGDERYAVQDAAKKSVNGDEKVNILLGEGLIKAVEAAAVEAPAEEAPAEEVAAEAPAEDSEESSEDAE